MSVVFKWKKLFHSGINLTSRNLSSKPSYFHYHGKDSLVYRTIGQQLAISAEKYGNREALISCHENIRLTFAELKSQADRLAAGFREIGLQPGDRIGIWAPNNSNWYLTMLAAARCGLITVGLNPAYQIPEVKYCLKKVNVKALIAPEGFKTQNYYKMLNKILPGLEFSKSGEIDCKEIPSLKTIIMDSDKKLNGTLSLNCIKSLPNESSIREIENLQFKIKAESPCSIQFTSGTTGIPKAAYLSHFSYVNNSYFIGARSELDQKHHIALIQMPYFHAYALVIVLLAGLHHGTTNVSAGPMFKAKESVDAILKEKCTFIYGIPTMYVDLIKTVKEQNIKLESPEIAITGGAPCSPKLFEDIKDTLGLKKIKTLFGLTEVTAVAFQSFPDDTKDKILNTVGHLQDHVEAKVIDEHGDIVPFGTPGELCIRGYSTMLGYWDDQEKTNEIMDESKWLKTGDKFILQPDGYGKIVGRIKDMIIRGGENIFPKEIEDYLNTHPKILESHVIGVSDERMGEEICAFIRLAKNESLDYDEMKKFCTGKIAHFKIPKYMKIIDNFPKTLSGKVQKFKLKELFN